MFNITESVIVLGGRQELSLTMLLRQASTSEEDLVTLSSAEKVDVSSLPSLTTELTEMTSQESNNLHSSNHESSIVAEVESLLKSRQDSNN